LFAPNIGLGSCWAGLLELAAFAGHQKLLDLFKIPEGKVFTGAMMVGYPKYIYKRLVDRNPLDVRWL
jgi:nitroreductase